MYKSLAAIIAVFTMCGCSSTPDDILVSGIRAQLGDSLKGAPYQASRDDLCAIAAAVVTETLRDGVEGPLDPVLRQGSKRSDVDCSAGFTPTGLPLADTSLVKEGLRVFIPEQLNDGRVAVSTAYFCEGWCGAHGATYIVYRQAEEWIVDPQPVISWIQ